MGLLGWVWLGILGEQQGRLKHVISSLDVGLQMFQLLVKLAFPFGSNFYLSISSFLPPTCLMPGWKWESLRGFSWAAGWL